MDDSYYYAITVGFPNFDVALDGQGEPQQQVYMQPNLTQFQILGTGAYTLYNSVSARTGNVTYKTVMQDITAVFTMVETSSTSIFEAMCALKKTTEDLKYNIEQLGEFGGLSMYTIAYIPGLHEDNPDTVQQHRNLWWNFNICWLGAFQRYIDYPINDLDTDEMEKMGQIVIEFADYIERFGLVDYQMGIWEEEILDRET